MKRSRGSREDAALHEAGHLVMIALTDGFRPGDFIWHCVSEYEICYVEPIETAPRDWESPPARNALIARQVAIAVAGGAAEAMITQRSQPPWTTTSIHTWTGRVDYELAHEWLTLQRYDPDQDTLEREIQRLYSEVMSVMVRHGPLVRQVADRVRRRIDAAANVGQRSLRLPAAELLEGIRLSSERCQFQLLATLMGRTQ